MKRLLSFLLFAAMLMFFGCSNDSGNPTGVGNVGTGGGNVTFAMGIAQGPQGGIVFTFKPSANVTLKTLVLKLPGQQFEDTITNPDPATVFEGGTEYSTEQEYTGVVSGQQWEFTFTGNVGSTTGSAFTVTSTYTIP